MPHNRDPYHSLRLTMRDMMASDDGDCSSDDDWISLETLQETIGQGYKLTRHQPEVRAFARRLARLEVGRTFEASVMRLLENRQLDENSRDFETIWTVILVGLREIRQESARLDREQVELESEKDSLEDRLHQIRIKENKLSKEKMEVDGRISAVKRAYGDFMGWDRRKANSMLGSDDEWDEGEDDEGEDDDDEEDEDVDEEDEIQ